MCVGDDVVLEVGDEGGFGVVGCEDVGCVVEGAGLYRFACELGVGGQGVGGMGRTRLGRPAPAPSSRIVRPATRVAAWVSR